MEKDKIGQSYLKVKKNGKETKMKILSHVGCLIAVLMLLAGVASADLVAHWTFDEGQGTVVNDSAGNNDGTNYGATWATGPLAGALSFDHTNDYVAVADDPSLRFSQTSSFTLACWANVETGSMLISKMRGAGQRGVFGYQLQYAGGVKQAFYFSLESSYVNTVSVGTGVNSAVPGVWYYVTAVYDNKNIKIYLNGELKGTGIFNYNTGTTTPDGPLGIGARIANGLPMNEWYFGGSLDDMRIYNEALSDDSVMQLYQDSLAYEEPNLVSIEIAGPNEVAENTQTPYEAIAYYDDGSSKDVTKKASWSVEDSDFADIDANGLLWTDIVFTFDTVCTIDAEMQDGNDIFTARKQVKILTLCTRPELIKRNLEVAKQVKTDVQDDLNYALKAETASQKMLLDMQREKDYSLWRLVDIVRARVYTQIAVLKENVAKEKIQSSNQDLSNALKTLEVPEKKIKNNKKL
jgi:hypothetical protein